MGYLNHLDPLIIFAILLGFSLLIPEFFRRYRILVVPVYIIVGIILGPCIIGIESHPALELLAEIGIFFLVFEAGLEFINTSMKCTTRHDHLDPKIGGISPSWRSNHV